MTKQQVTICPDVQIGNLRQLAASVILQAVNDAKNTRAHLEDRLDAVLWLAGGDMGFWLEWAGMPHADMVGAMTSGATQKARTRRTNGTRSE